MAKFDQQNFSKILGDEFDDYSVEFIEKLRKKACFLYTIPYEEEFRLDLIVKKFYTSVNSDVSWIIFKFNRFMSISELKEGAKIYLPKETYLTEMINKK